MNPGVHQTTKQAFEKFLVRTIEKLMHQTSFSLSIFFVDPEGYSSNKEHFR